MTSWSLSNESNDRQVSYTYPPYIFHPSSLYGSLFYYKLLGIQLYANNQIILITLCDLSLDFKYVTYGSLNYHLLSLAPLIINRFLTERIRLNLYASKNGRGSPQDAWVRCTLQVAIGSLREMIHHTAIFWKHSLFVNHVNINYSDYDALYALGCRESHDAVYPIFKCCLRFLIVFLIAWLSRDPFTNNLEVIDFLLWPTHVNNLI